MQLDARVFVAGHRGLVGSAITRNLQARGHRSLLLRSRSELDLTDAARVQAFFEQERPEYVILAAAKVGGILANNNYPAEFIRENLAIQTHVIHSAWKVGVKRLLFLGSSCIYPRLAPQPMPESCLLTGPLEPTNRAYALAKIAGIEMCSSYNRQYGTRYLAAMPTNLYGPGDNYHPENSHVIPALLRRFHEAKQRGDSVVTVWGSGTPRREFLYSDDMADACVYLMSLDDAAFAKLLGSDSSAPGENSWPLVNIGAGSDISIADLAEAIRRVTGYEGAIEFDRSKPDGTPRKLMDVSVLAKAGWSARTPLDVGLRHAYGQFVTSLR
jgi:GDP-L-fucose synthase